MNEGKSYNPSNLPNKTNSISNLPYKIDNNLLKKEGHDNPEKLLSLTEFHYDQQRKQKRNNPKLTDASTSRKESNDLKANLSTDKPSSYLQNNPDESFNNQKLLSYNKTQKPPIMPNDIQHSLNDDSKLAICPKCSHKFLLLIEDTTKQINKTLENRNKVFEFDDCNLEEKIKSHSLSIKSNFKTGLLSFKSQGPLAGDKEIYSSFEKSPERDQGINTLLLDLAEKKTKLAEALNINDEMMHKLQKKDNEIKMLIQRLIDKDEKLAILQNEIFSLNQENCDSKQIIKELNQSNQHLIKQINTLTKLKLIL